MSLLSLLYPKQKNQDERNDHVGRGNERSSQWQFGGWPAAQTPLDHQVKLIWSPKTVDLLGQGSLLPLEVLNRLMVFGTDVLTSTEERGLGITNGRKERKERATNKDEGGKR